MKHVKVVGWFVIAGFILVLVPAAAASENQGADPVALGEKFGAIVGPADNLTIGTWEPATPDDQGATAQMNFHFVPNRVD